METLNLIQDRNTKYIYSGMLAISSEKMKFFRKRENSNKNFQIAGIKT